MGYGWGLDAPAHPSTMILWPRVTCSFPIHNGNDHIFFEGIMRFEYDLSLGHPSNEGYIRLDEIPWACYPNNLMLPSFVQQIQQDSSQHHLQTSWSRHQNCCKNVGCGYDYRWVKGQLERIGKIKTIWMKLFDAFVFFSWNPTRATLYIDRLGP